MKRSQALADTILRSLCTRHAVPAVTRVKNVRLKDARQSTRVQSGPTTPGDTEGAREAAAL